jgi:1-acyl-sn-glycerol-3-phosphate acyltransferase
MFYLRAGLVVIWFVVSFAVCLVVSLVRWRHPSGGFVFTYVFSRTAFRILGINVLVRNAERLKSAQPCIYVGNHQSNLDVISQAYCYQPRTIAVGKKEVAWIPLFGIIFYTTGNIFIDRSNRQRALRSLGRANEALTKKNISIYMFPEGTRNKGSTQLLPFKKGAFHMAIDAQVPILPIVSGPFHMLLDVHKRMLKKGTLIFEVLEPIPTAGMTEADIDKLIHLTHSRMQESFSKISAEMQSLID